MPHSILIVDDEKSFREFLELLFIDEGFEVLLAKNLTQAKEILTKKQIDIILSDLILGREDGLSLVKWVKQQDINIPFILMTAYASSETAIESAKLGVMDYITKPFDTDELLSMVNNFLIKENKGEGCCKELDEIIGQSDKIVSVKKTIIDVAPTDSNVLITGESGTGKELVARAIHRLSKRKDAPFIAINCGAIPQELLESEMFGYKKGAFTGATSDKLGFFQLAHKGTIFLDEIAEMPLFLQVKLLRVLQDSKITPLGSSNTDKVDIRVIAATNVDIEKAVEREQFRKDLYYRLNVVNIFIPPLRDRTEDIIPLANHFIKKYSEKMNKNIIGLSYPVAEILTKYNYFGNIRELENIIERAIIMEKSNKILPSSLPKSLLVDSGKNLYDNKETDDEIPQNFKLEKYVENIERKFILKALKSSGGNQSRAAKILGLSLRVFRYKLEKYGIKL
jgi:two-component system response regulator PilR (NtrC family)